MAAKVRLFVIPTKEESEVFISPPTVLLASSVASHTSRFGNSVGHFGNFHLVFEVSSYHTPIEPKNE